MNGKPLLFMSAGELESISLRLHEIKKGKPHGFPFLIFSVTVLFFTISGLIAAGECTGNSGSEQN